MVAKKTSGIVFALLLIIISPIALAQSWPNPGHPAWQVGGGTFNASYGNFLFPAALNLTADTNTFHVDATWDRVGIGTTTPAYKLETITTGTGALRLQSASSTVGGPTIDMWDSGRSVETVISSYDGATAGTYIAAYSSHPLMFSTAAGQAKMTLDTNGKLGIGTKSPNATLHVVGTINSTGDICTATGNKCLSSAGGSEVDTLATVTARGNTTAQPVTIDSDSNEVTNIANTLYINGTNDRVGIGTSNPGSPLEIYSSATDPLTLRQTGAGDNFLKFYSTTTNRGTIGWRQSTGFIIKNEDNSAMDIGTYSSPNAVKILDIGYVGINTTNPVKTLHVNGSIAVKENEYIGAGSGYGCTGCGAASTIKMYNSSTGDMELQTGTSYDVVLQPGGGNVGIGTSNPNARLEVAASNYNIPGINVTNSGHAAGIGVDANGANWGAAIFQDGAERFIIESNGGALIGTSYMTLNAPANGLAVQGKVGIGTVNPNTTLHVVGTINSTGDICYEGGNKCLSALGTGSMTNWILGGDSGTNQQVDNAEVVNISGSGGITTTAGATNKVTVGINWASVSGDAIPESKIDIDTACASPGALYQSGNDLACRSNVVDGTGSANRAAFWTDGDTISYDNSFVWDNTNKLMGLGTTAPLSKLHIENQSNLGASDVFTGLRLAHYTWNDAAFPATAASRIAFDFVWSGATRQTVAAIEGHHASSWGGGLLFLTSPQGASTNVPIARMGLYPNGNLGINITSTDWPDTELHVKGGLCVDTDAACTDPGDGNVNIAGDTTTSGGDVTGANGMSIDLGEQAVDSIYINDTDGSGYPNIYCAAGSTATYCEFLSGLYVNGGNLITTYQYYARGGILNDQGNLTLSDNVTISNNLVVATSLLFADSYNDKVGIGTATPTQKLEVSGNANITGTIYYGGNLTGYGADFAEMFYAAEAVGPGDVVCLDENMKIVKCSKRADPSVAGIVSENPTIMGNAANGNIPVAIVGIVSTKVKGPIARFDMLTSSSTPGYAERASKDDFGSIVGKAMESCEANQCVIKVLVSLR